MKPRDPLIVKLIRYGLAWPSSLMAAEEKRTTAYHRVRNDIREALASLRLKLVHEDGTEPGKSCVGFLAGKLHEASKTWHEEIPAAGPEQDLDHLRLHDPGAENTCGRCGPRKE